jgi:CheY-like chemotaxis protein
LQPIILNVDDNEAARYAKTRLLRNAGFDVEEAACGREVMPMLKQHPISLILLDVKLPDCDGIELCRQIRAEAGLESIAIVHTSAAYIAEADVQRGLAGGANAYLTSPFEPSALLEVVRRCLD